MNDFTLPWMAAFITRRPSWRPARLPVLLAAMQSDRVSLEKGTLLSIAPPLGCRIECIRGAVWITHDGDMRDTAISANESYVADRQSRMLVQALEASALHILRPLRAEISYRLRPVASMPAK